MRLERCYSFRSQKSRRHCIWEPLAFCVWKKIVLWESLTVRRKNEDVLGEWRLIYCVDVTERGSRSGWRLRRWFWRWRWVSLTLTLTLTLTLPCAWLCWAFMIRRITVQRRTCRRTLRTRNDCLKFLNLLRLWSALFSACEDSEYDEDNLREQHSECEVSIGQMNESCARKLRYKRMYWVRKSMLRIVISSNVLHRGF